MIFVIPHALLEQERLKSAVFPVMKTISLVREMLPINFIGMDLVEVLPTIDPSGRTAYMAGNIIHELLAIKALQKKLSKNSSSQ